jgi:glyoxylase-like metal-dependent hydrolase (beta-lactamase superfamily II)
LKIHPRVTQISTPIITDNVELYLIRGERNALIDTGTPLSPRNDIAPVLKDLGLTLEDIDLILNTHGHFDHTGGDSAVKSVSNAQILIHTDEVFVVEDHERFFNEEFGLAVEAIMGREHIEEEKKRFLEIAGPDVVVDGQLADNDIIELGDGCKLRVIHLPGHSCGSVGFYWEEEGMLFSGDSLQGLHHGSALPIITDLKAYIKSLERLKGLPLQLILQGHQFRGRTLPPSPIRKHEDIPQYLQDCQEIAERISEAISHILPHASEKMVIELVDEVVAELPQEMGFKPVSQIPAPLLGSMTVFFSLRQERP